MKRLSEPEVLAILERPHLTEHERTVAKQFYVDKIRANVISHRLGLSVSAVTSVLTLARRKATQPRLKVQAGRRKKAVLDDAWFARNVALVRQLAVDEDHQQRYLSGVERVYGVEMRRRMEAAV